MKKSVYLTVFGISIVVAAVSLGVTLTRYLGLRAYSPKGAAQAAAVPAVPAVPAAPPEEWNNLFAPAAGMKLASRLPTVDAKTGSQASRSNFVLVGTIVSSTPSATRAVLWANGMKEPKAFREKEEVEPGAFLSSVERDKAWITRGNAREKLEILPVGSRVRPMAATARPTAPAAASTNPLPVLPKDTPAAPGIAPATRPTPGGTQAVTAPDVSSVAADEEGASRQELRKRSRRGRR